MRIKKLLSVVGLGLFAAVSVGAGVALAKSPTSNVAKADDPKTWMSMVTIDMTNIIDGSDGSISNVRWHAWGTDYDQTFVMHESGYAKNYTVMVSFTDAQSVSGFQFIFTQTGGAYPGEKYSVDKAHSLSKSTVNPDIRLISDNTWDGESKWGLSSVASYKAFSWFGGVSHDYDRDPVKQVLSVKNITVSNANFYVESRIINGSISDYTRDITRTDSMKYVHSSGTQYLELEYTYTYDFFVYNNYSDSGIFEIKRHEDASASFIYYVLENNIPTKDYIYSWGGSEQFGEWPGTKITDVTDVEEVTGGGDLHFEGSDTPKLIYRIPITRGYPTGDLYFKWNNGKGSTDPDKWESPTSEIILENAYWYTAVANADAGHAIDFLTLVEAYRTGASGSVCNISETNAKFLVNTYNAHTDEVRDYVDRSKVYTFKVDKSEGKELVSYRKVMEELARIGKVTLTGSSPRPTSIIGEITAENGALIAVVAAIALISISSVAILLVIKKRKHE